MSTEAEGLKAFTVYGVLKEDRRDYSRQGGIPQVMLVIEGEPQLHHTVLSTHAKGWERVVQAADHKAAANLAIASFHSPYAEFYVRPGLDGSSLNLNLVHRTCGQVVEQGRDSNVEDWMESILTHKCPKSETDEDEGEDEDEGPRISIDSGQRRRVHTAGRQVDL